MKQVCLQCKTENSQNARFCEACGFSLGATMTHGHTVVAPPITPLEIPKEQTRTAIRNIEKTFGANHMTFGASDMNASRAAQREQTIIAMDTSDSMGEKYDGEQNKLDASKRSITALVLDKDPYDEIGIVAFNSRARRVLGLCPIHSHKRQIFQAIQSLSPHNGTDINQGLICAKDSFDWSRNDVVRRLILESDGLGGDPRQTAEELKSRGVIIDVIGVGPSEDKINKKLLQSLASVIEGQSRYTFITNSQMLTMAFSTLAAKTSTY